MNPLIQLGLLFTCTLIVSIVLIKMLIKPLVFFGMLDVPSDRRAHQSITPRGAGIVLVLVLIVGGTLFEYQFTSSFNVSFKLMPVFLLISAISFLDDIKTIPIFIRLIVHLLSAWLSIFLFLYPKTILHQELPGYIDLILSIIAFTAFLNIYNFLDGVDGITAVESIHLSITILVLCYLKYDVIINVNLIIVISILICAFSIAFLLFNWYPASIFIGDVGSISLGFLLGLCLLFIAASGERLFASASIAVLYYLGDGGLTILIRLINKEKIWQPHLKHFFQKAIKSGMSPNQVVTRVILCNALLMILSISSLYYPVISVVISIIVVMITLIKFSRCN